MKEVRSLAGALALSATAAFLLATPNSSRAMLEKQEQSCSKSLAKAAIKVNASIVKTVAKCRIDDMKGKACDLGNAKVAAKIQKAKDSVSKIAKKCSSTCSTAQDVSCIDNLDCPPRGATGGRCSGNGKQKFELRNLGFPGYFCPEAEFLGSDTIADTGDLSQCVSAMGSAVADATVSNIFGSTTAPLSDAAMDCLSEIAKSLPKTISSIAKAVGKCRDKQAGLSIPTIDPANCATADEKTKASIDKAEGRLSDSLDKKCSDAAVAELDLCESAGGAVTTLDGAKSCLRALAEEAVQSSALPDDRVYVRAGLINTAYPASQVAVCGDNKANQTPSPFQRLGEECDGADDSACPGQCFPPGDLWQCTCANTPRIQQLADGGSSDLDVGWTGSAHDSKIADFSGFTVEVSNCNCGGVTGATCTGATSDSVCELLGRSHPVCSTDLSNPLSCTEQGNHDSVDTDSDCQICDARSTNPGDYCVDDSDCQSQCFDRDTGLAVAPQVLCSRQSDCAGVDGVCLGRCDTTPTCVLTSYDAPTPLTAGGTAACAVDLFSTDVEGTQDIVTGEHEIGYALASFTHLAESVFRPCPVCGGFCGGGAARGRPCKGSCDVSGAPCRFDDDCTGAGDSACTTVSTNCPDNLTTGEKGYCTLELICSGGTPSEGTPCRVEADTPFGTTSNDCQPDNNISGATGLALRRFPTTSERVSHGSSGSCTASGWENFMCPCPATPRGGSVQSRPNLCRAACDQPGPDFGRGCGTGNGNGVFTVCDGGDEDGAACDQDSDCSGGGSCSRNPVHCIAGDADKLQNACSSNADCGNGGVCGDACPGGRCVPLCIETGACSGGDRPGGACGTNSDCSGGGVCNLVDANDGVCAAGPPFTHCDGEGWGFIVCTAGQVGTQTSCEAGVDGILGSDDDIPGAGYCREDMRNCFLIDPVTGEHGVAEGGDIFNPPGDSTNFRTVSAYCIADAESGAINSTAGLGGPGRLRAAGVNAANFSSLP